MTQAKQYQDAKRFSGWSLTRFEREMGIKVKIAQGVPGFRQAFEFPDGSHIYTDGTLWVTDTELQ